MWGTFQVGCHVVAQQAAGSLVASGPLPQWLIGFSGAVRMHSSASAGAWGRADCA